MELTLEEKQALAAARARARKRAAEAQAEGRPWEKFKSQDEDFKPVGAGHASAGRGTAEAVGK